MKEHTDAVIETLKAVPPVSVGALTFFGFPLDSFVLIVTAIYTSLLLFFLVKDKLIPWVKTLFKKD